MLEELVKQPKCTTIDVENATEKISGLQDFCFLLAGES
jgi:hypothetical protein